MKFIIHIGTHKTGSTLIQKLCDKNHEKLRKNGIYYPIDSYSQSGQHELAWAIKNKDHEQADKLIDGILASCGSCQKVLLSSEEFEFISDFSYLKEKLKGHSIEVVAFLRRQDKYLESEYNQHVKMFDVKYSEDIFKFFMFHNFEQRFNYHRLLHRWQENLFDVNIKAFSYDKLAKSGTLVQTFFKEVLGLEYTDIIDHNDVDKKSNVSINPMGLIYLARFNKESNIDAATFQRFIKIVSDYDFSEANGKKNGFLSRDFAIRVVGRYAVSNKQTAIKYCNGVELFDNQYDDNNVVDYYREFDPELYNKFKRQATDI